MRNLNLNTKTKKYYQYEISCTYLDGWGHYIYNSKEELQAGDYVSVVKEFAVGKVIKLVRIYDANKVKPNAKFIVKISKEVYDKKLEAFPRILEQQEAFGRYLEKALHLSDALWQ